MQRMLAVIGIFGINLSACGIEDINLDRCIIRLLAANESQILCNLIKGGHSQQGKVR